ncbi:hypothetical protein C8F01DRAFT_1374938 [Mycena amicta]|nr:hypothetical protein C8F01DRAFT_1237195 [Mycena amicta]KAJ7053655.1 hypothetical protein C8F01DRAFT_1374938 [Mycena amicta]
MAATQLSLFDELTHLTQPGYPVTEVLQQLLQLVGHDVCLSKRNHHAVYWAVSRARDVVDNINALIKVASEGDSWEAYDKYTVMVLWIEKVLLTFSLITEKESIAARFGASENVLEDIAFIEAFRDNRRDLREVLQQLINSGYLTGDVGDHTKAVKAIQRQDDLSAFRATIARLREYAKNLRSPGKEALTEVIRRLDALHTTLSGAPDTLADDVFLFALQCALLLEIVASRRDKKMAARVQDKELWQKALGWIIVADKHAKDANLSPAGLSGEYSAAVIYITGDILIEIPEAFKKLRPLVALTRRPYYSQSVAIVAGCAELATTFAKQKTFDRLNPFNAALDQATAALNAAAGVQYNPTVPFVKIDSVSTTFEAAEAAIKQCFQEYQIVSSVWERRMVNSRESDAERLGLLEKRFKGPAKPLPTEKIVDIVISVTVPGTKNPTARAYKMDGALTLHAILWKEAALRTSVTAANDVRNKGYFHTPTSGQMSDKTALDLDTEIAKLPESQGRKVVALVVPNL